jgi:hypothetical protein
LVALLPAAHCPPPADPIHVSPFLLLLQKNYIYNYDSDDSDDHVDGIECNEMLNEVQSAIHHVQSALNSLRDAVKRKILKDTRVFVCTIDATARMVVELAELQVRCRCRQLCCIPSARPTPWPFGCC